ncbi:MAG TPA: aspartyl/asparaginyl beta-hydroxylase domain-containing protein [Thermoanaerobaculia bacterium]|jgi:hypothetical protein
MPRRMITALRLPMTFDADRLQADLAAIEGSGWRRHFNRGYFDGEWSGIPLRLETGHRHPLAYLPPPDRGAFVDAPLLAECSYIPEVLGAFDCPLRLVRLLRLTPGSIIREHRDDDLSFEEGLARFHIPIATNDEVEFILGGEKLVLRPGECWYMNFDLPHSLANRGATDRVHLVVDVEVNAWVRDLFGNIAQ